MSSLFRIDCNSQEAIEAARIAKERIAEFEEELTVKYDLRLSFESLQLDADPAQAAQTDVYQLEVSLLERDLKVIIRSRLRRNYIAGTGKLLEWLLADLDGEASMTAGITNFTAQCSMRIHYMPGHFGNSFEVCWSSEMKRYLEDLALAGASGYGDWFDPNDMPDPYHSHVYHSSSMFLWNRKKEWLAYSQQLGLDNIIVVTPNVGFVDQMRPEWVGVRNHKLRVQGQVLCPSNREAREVCLQNQRNLFSDLQTSGIKIEKLVFAPYDDGGCACSKCQPYYPVFLALVKDVYQEVSVYYPEVKVDICGWWTSEDEGKLLRRFIEGPAKSWFSSFQISAAYGVFELPEVPELEDLSTGCFLHIGFSNDNRDVYTKTGVHIAAARLQSVIRSFPSRQCEGFMTYNESFGDHYNAFIASQLGWNSESSLRELTSFYCRMILGLRGQHLQTMVDILLDMQYLEQAKAEKWAKRLDGLTPYVKVHPLQQWAFEHIRLKAKLMALDDQIEAQAGHNIEAVLPIMEQRLELSERLWRQVYGFGVLRHILIPERMLPAWYQDYKKHSILEEGFIQSGKMSSEA